MDTKEVKIRDGLKRIAAAHGPIMLFDGQVVAVDSAGYFCDVQLDTDTVTITNVRLRAASIGNKSIDVLPSVGSEVVIAKIAEDDFLLLAADEIDSYRVTVGTMVLTVTNSGFSISNGSTSLKSILNGFVTQMLAIYAPKDIGGINALTIEIDGLFN